MPALDEITRLRLARSVVSLEGAIAQFEAQATKEKDVEPTIERLQRLRDDISAVLDLARPHAARS